MKLVFLSICLFVLGVGCSTTTYCRCGGLSWDEVEQFRLRASALVRNPDESVTDYENRLKTEAFDGKVMRFDGEVIPEALTDLMFDKSRRVSSRFNENVMVQAPLTLVVDVPVVDQSGDKKGLFVIFSIKTKKIEEVILDSFGLDRPYPDVFDTTIM